MKRIIILAILVLSLFAIGCSKESDEPATRISGQTTYDAEPEIDKSYDVAREEPVKTTTRTTTTAPAVSDEDRAKKIATDYIKNLAGYKYYNGRNLVFKSVVKTGGTGNWIVDATFERDAQASDYEKVEPINVHLNIRSWKADSYTFN